MISIDIRFVGARPFIGGGPKFVVGSIDCCVEEGLGVLIGLAVRVGVDEGLEDGVGECVGDVEGDSETKGCSGIEMV